MSRLHCADEFRRHVARRGQLEAAKKVGRGHLETAENVERGQLYLYRAQPFRRVMGH